MNALKHIKFVWLLVTLSLISCGRNLQEQSFVQEVNKMLDGAEYGTYSDEVMQSIFDYIKNNPQSFEYEFEEELSHIRIATSDDGNVRAYNLERSGFEGNPSWGFECKTLLQYRSGEDVFCEVFDNLDGYVTRICHIDSSKYYLLETFQGHISQGIHESYKLYVYKVDNNKLHEVKKCFVSRDGISDNLEFSWNNNGGYLGEDFALEDYAFVYNNFHKELFALKSLSQIGMPLRYHQYIWDGKLFEIRKYDEPLEYYNDTYFIRIEQHSENSWMYKCWNGGRKHGEPNLIIKGGTKQYWLYNNSLISYDEWVTDDASSPLGEKYTFFNNGYRYEYYDGWSNGEQLESLDVYDSRENIVYSGDFTSVLHYEEDD